MIIRFCTEENEISLEGLKEIGKKTKEKIITQTQISKDEMKKKFLRFMKTGEVFFITNEVWDENNKLN